MKGYKLLLIMLMAMLIIASLTLSAFAYESEGEAPDTASGETATEGTEETSELTPKGEAGEDANLFSELFERVKGSLTELLCLVTVVCSVIMTYAFKKGIFPLVKGGIAAMKNAIGNIEESSNATSLFSKELGDRITEKLCGAEDRLDAMCENMTKLEAMLTPTDEQLKQSRAQTKLLYGQLELISDVFMAVALPQSLKDEILVRISEMKRAVMENEEG